MKTKIGVLVVVVAFVAASCEKCHDCHYEGVDGEVEIGNYCGDDLEAIEASGFTVGDSVYTVHCEEH